MFILHTSFLLVFISSSFYQTGVGQQQDGPGQLIIFPSSGIGSPNITFSCGSVYRIAHYGADVNKTYKVPIYYYNTTADKLASEGYQITVNEMHGDALKNFTASNGTHSANYGFEHWFGVAAAGGEPAKKERAYYMAQLGVKRRQNIVWLCDGVLINREWVLTAAHCFLNPTAEPDLVRLGDYDLNEPEEQNNFSGGKFVWDYEMAEVVFHPEFELGERYHDLALIRIPKKYPQYSNSIRPICLPWNSLTNKNLIGMELVLTGWGATEYGGPKTALLQQLKLEVFPTTTCNRSYFGLRDFRRRYPAGMDDSNILCVGANTDGKDACGGDSGAPVVYTDKEKEAITLAGIVSGGFGCGIKEFPGLYIPVSKPKYLQWIKDVAFKEFI